MSNTHDIAVTLFSCLYCNLINSSFISSIFSPPAIPLNLAIIFRKCGIFSKWHLNLRSILGRLHLLTFVQHHSKQIIRMTTYLRTYAIWQHSNCCVTLPLHWLFQALHYFAHKVCISWGFWYHTFCTTVSETALGCYSLYIRYRVGGRKWCLPLGILHELACGFLHCDPNKMCADSVLPRVAFSIIKIHQHAPTSSMKNNTNCSGAYEELAPCFQSLEEIVDLVQNAGFSFGSLELNDTVDSDFVSLVPPPQAHHLLSIFCNGKNWVELNVDIPFWLLCINCNNYQPHWLRGWASCISITHGSHASPYKSQIANISGNQTDVHRSNRQQNLGNLAGTIPNRC